MEKSLSHTIESKIYLLRGHKVMLDYDLAQLYNVETRSLVQAVKRNPLRFPPDFMFQLDAKEADSLRSQIVILKKGGRGRHSKYLPYAFTEQGVAMLASVLRSGKAIEINIQIVRAFVKLRILAHEHKALWKKIEEMESKYDQQFRSVFEALRELLIQEEKPKRRMGFVTD